MNTTNESSTGYRSTLTRYEGVFAVVLMATWSIASIILVGVQNGGVTA